jgi:glycosyltransferase involved in cell wall biosynthesis
MAFGAVPLAGAVARIPQILDECQTGMALDLLETGAFAEAIFSYVNEPARWERESQAARQAAYRFTYEAYLQHLQNLFAEQWGVQILNEPVFLTSE